MVITDFFLEKTSILLGGMLASSGKIDPVVVSFVVQSVWTGEYPGPVSKMIGDLG